MPRPAPRTDSTPSPLALTDPARGERLQRVLADAGVASRRACEALIAQGHVRVNSVLVTALPVFVDPATDRIEVDGRPVRPASPPITVMLNKPTRTLSTARDDQIVQRRTIVELVDHPAAARLFPVGRLDYDTTGLILLTNDGELANRLTHPRFGVVKTYQALVRGRLDDADLSKLERGIFLAERRAGRTIGAVRAAHVGITIARRDRDTTLLEITLGEGRNRQVRRMLAAVGCPVKRLERIAMGPVKLSGLARGQWRELTHKELTALRRASEPGRKATDSQPAKPASRARSRQAPGTKSSRPATNRMARDRTRQGQSRPSQSRKSKPSARPASPSSPPARRPTRRPSR